MSAASKARLAAERARERDLCSYYPLALHIPDSTSASGPRPSADSVLTALAQLAALRLPAARALISLIDSQSQIILAEATPALPLRSHGRDGAGHGHGLWLGSVSVPREGGICETVLSEDAVVINDLQADERFRDCSFVQQPPYARFYAGVPLKSAAGHAIGVFCVIDDRPRDGLDDDQLLYLHDVAATTVSYLAASRAQDTNSKAEQMVRGLTSFVTGAADLQNSEELDVPRPPAIPSSSSPFPSRRPVPAREQPHSETSRSTPSDQTQPADALDDDDTISLQDQILPPGSKRMFSRAANIMRESCNLEGVIFFDASVANSSPPDVSPPEASAEDSDIDCYLVSSSAGDDSSESNPSSDSTGASSTTCKILGFADTARSSRDGNVPRRDYLGLSETALRRLLNRHPDGKIFNISKGDFDQIRRRRRGKPKGKTAVDVIVDVAHNARSAAVIPLWDFERQRWFAGCLCWVSTPNRLLTYGSDLLYLRAFGHSVMTELSRIESVAIDQAKTTFVESMSHELRSPLHGMLGGVEYLQSTTLDTFQNNILNSISMCGRTLLDTVSNLLEYSKINEVTGPNPTSPGERRRRRLAGRVSSSPAVDICQLTEETVEAVFSGQSYNIYPPPSDGEDDYFSSSASPSSPPVEKPIRKAVRVILDMPHRSSWAFSIEPGIWRRILMNVFGNALKFTTSGFIRVSLAAMDVEDERSEITLSVVDSGIGMSLSYLQDGLFKPFSKATPFSSGAGLGMSVVKRLVQTLGGDITVTSREDAGTEVKVCITLQKGMSLPGSRHFEAYVTRRANAMPVSLVREHIPHHDQSLALYALSERYFHSSLASTLNDWFSIRTADSDVHSDSSQLVLYPGPIFNSMFQTRSHTGVSVVIALDGIEATTLRMDPRVTQGQVEVVVQPCGPSKLARILHRYLKRLDNTSTPPPPPDIAPFSASSPTSITPVPPPSPFPNPSPAHDDEQTPTAPVSSDPLPFPSSTVPLPHRQRHPSPSRTASVPSPSKAAARTTKEILIVDDNPLNLRLLSAFLHKHGLPHTSARNGLEAVNLFKSDRKRWAAVLMDLSMPVMDGVTATREIRAWERRCGSLRDGVHIVVITGLGSATARFEATSAGADIFMTKPIQFAALMKTLRGRV
ncbi:hypothetical protein B0J12DRAFT_605645 [Macrophomina phaseolina]|uniref:histidine kinase n=1 Tax=Macrophomina phaseolina TaxID=35725 RepID=A0ABQ8G1L8_9PEZI|nr:hypothetical protein B0J12DRAFT_605645 [Macrophomina phaseolina]